MCLFFVSSFNKCYIKYFQTLHYPFNNQNLDSHSDDQTKKKKLFSQVLSFYILIHLAMSWLNHWRTYLEYYLFKYFTILKIKVTCRFRFGCQMNYVLFLCYLSWAIWKAKHRSFFLYSNIYIKLVKFRPMACLIVISF